MSRSFPSRTSSTSTHACARRRARPRARPSRAGVGRRQPLWLAVLLALAGPAAAIEPARVAIRHGTVINLQGADAEAEHTALALVFALPWQGGDTWRWRTGLDITASTYSGATDTAAFSVGPVIGTRKGDSRFLFEAGVQLTYLTEPVLGSHDMGCEGQFTTHLAAFYDLGSQWSLGYRLQHISNASLCDVNPGINSHMAELRYRF